MPYFMFRFYFPDIAPELQEVSVECWGGKFTTALKKSWERLRGDTKYHDIRGLRPNNISVFVLKKKKPAGYLSWEQRLPKMLTGPQAAASLMKSS